MGEERWLPGYRAREIAVEVGDRRLNALALAATADGVVHPGAAALGVSRVEIHVELANQGFSAVAHVEEAHVFVPDWRQRRRDVHLVQGLGDAEQSADR